MEKDNQKTLELRQIYCSLTQEERNEKSKTLVSRLEEKRSLEHEFSREVSSHKEAIKAAKEFYAEKIGEISGLINELLPAVSTGKEKREVYCMVKYNTPEAGFKMVQRQDTGEEWQEDMTSEEIDNLLLFAPSPAKEEEEEQGSDPDPEEDSEDSSESCGNYDESEMMAEEEETREETYVPGFPLICTPGKVYNVNGSKYEALPVPADMHMACDSCDLAKNGCPRKQLPGKGRDMSFDCIEFDVYFKETE